MTPGPDPHAVPVDLHSARTQNLLAYLALHPERPIDRRQLAFALWSDSSESNALRFMRQHLHRLRQVLHTLDLPEEILSTTPGQIQFNPRTGLWVDVLLFRRFVTDRGRQIEAIELYAADLLPDNDSEWLHPIRERLHEQYLQTLRVQINAAKMQRNYPRALYYAQRLLEAAPQRESAHRIFMEALYFNGQRVEALRQFYHLESMLRQRFDARPMPETDELYRQIKAGTLPRDLPLLIASSRQVPAALERITQLSTAFVGRREELARLDEALAETIHGAGRFVLIDGESGLGKSRLLHTWLVARAGQALTFFGRGTSEAEHHPFGVVLKAIRENRAQINWELFPPQFPHLTTFKRVLSRPDCAPSSFPRLSLEVEQVGQWLLTLAVRSERPLTFIIDDLHDVDDGTWQLLAYLAQRCEQYPLLLVGSYRRMALSVVARSLYYSLQRHRRLELIRLWPFTRGETERVATQLLDRRAGVRFLSTLYRATEGNPFYLLETLKAIQEGELDSPSRLLAGEVIPGSIRDSIEGRLASLGGESRGLLTQAAEIGRLFTFEALSGYQEAQQLEALEAWLRAGLVREHSEGYEFTHRLIYLVARHRPVPDIG